MKNKIIHIISLSIAAIFALITFIIYRQEASFVEKIIFALIIGFCTWLLLLISMWTLLWLKESLKK